LKDYLLGIFLSFLYASLFFFLGETLKTHIVREVNKPGSRLNKKEVVEAVTIVECPKMVVVGLVGYIETPRGLKKVKSLFAEHLEESVIRRFYKRYRGKDHYKAFTKYQKPEEWKKTSEKVVNFLKKKATVIRVLVHPKMKDIQHIGKIKAPLLEIQVNGGTVQEKNRMGILSFRKRSQSWRSICSRRLH